MAQADDADTTSLVVAEAGGSLDSGAGVAPPAAVLAAPAEPATVRSPARSGDRVPITTTLISAALVAFAVLGIFAPQTLMLTGEGSPLPAPSPRVVYVPAEAPSPLVTVRVVEVPAHEGTSLPTPSAAATPSAMPSRAPLEPPERFVVISAYHDPAPDAKHEDLTWFAQYFSAW
jgi:hypothetical protein